MRPLYESIFDQDTADVNVVLTSIVGDCYKIEGSNVEIDITNLPLDVNQWEEITQCLETHKLKLVLKKYCYIVFPKGDCVGGKNIPSHIESEPFQISVLGGCNFSNINIDVLGDTQLFTCMSAHTPPKFKNVNVNIKKQTDRGCRWIMINCEDPKGVNVSGIKSNYNALLIKPEFISGNPSPKWSKFEQTVLSNISQSGSTYECNIDVVKFFNLPLGVKIIQLQLTSSCKFQRIWFVKDAADLPSVDRRAYNMRTRNDEVPTSKDGWYVYAF